ncbi:MAG TPA: hypothetical protein VEH55_06775 [Gaiellaceae bacterium]|nr:hypothetical protein [Gaiellaceae bacterium]
MSRPSSGSWVLAALLRPVTFVLAIVAGVMTGDRTGTFWLGLLAYLIAMSAGRALRALVRSRVALAAYRAIWPAAAAGYAFLFGYLGLPGWANLIVTVIAAGMTKNALGGPIRSRPKWEWRQLEEWGVPNIEDIVQGRWKEL